MNHWLVLPIVLPAVLAPILLLLRDRCAVQRRVGLGGTALLLVLAVVLVSQSDQPQSYRLGNWPAPFGIVLVLDRLAALMLLVTATLALVIQLYTLATGWDTRGRHFHALYLFQLMGLNGAFLTADLFNLFVFFEVLLIASYGLMVHGGGRDRLRAGVHYVAMNLIGSTLFLFALGTVYAVTGTLNMADIGSKIALLPASDAALVRTAAVMLIGVFAIKGALVPLQFWLPGTYANAPGPVAALFAIMTKVGAYAILRSFSVVVPASAPAIGPLLLDVLMPCAALTAIVGGIGTMGATTLPRLAAMAAIASLGTLFLAIAAHTPQATAAALYYLVHSTLATAALFLVADQIAARRSAGLATGPRLPEGLALLFFGATIALAGLPPLSGFPGKLLVLDALHGRFGLWSVILLTSLAMILGFTRAGTTLFWTATADPPKHEPDPAVPALITTGLLLGLMALLTVFAGPVTDWLSLAAQDLHDPAAYIAVNRLGAP